LIESLVALSIVAIALSSIGALIASSIKGTRAIEGKLERLAVARSVLGALPDRNQLVIGTRSGEMAQHHWRFDITAFASNDIVLQQRGDWIPELVSVTVQSPTAGTMLINTVRLRRKDVP
jgi:general secretion pathway protein I